jgi:O-antigen ligase
MVVVGAILIHEKVRPLPVLVCGGGLCLILLLYAPEGYWARMATIGSREQDYNMTAQSGRLEVWKRGVGFMLANPVLGVGPNVFTVADGESRGGQGKWSSAHNSFVQIGAELGVTGLILFIYIIVTSLKAMRVSIGMLPVGAPQVGLLRAVEIGFYGYAASGFFLSMAYDTTLYLLVGLSVVVANLTRQTVAFTDKTGAIANVSAV